MMNPCFSLRELEFDKILESIARYAMTMAARDTILSLEPSDDIEKIRFDLDLIDEMQALLTFDDPFPFTAITDIRSFLKKIAAPGTTLNTDDLSKIRLTLEIYRKTIQYIERRKTKYPLLSELLSPISRYPEIEEAIQHAVDDQGYLRDDASPELRAIRRDILHTASLARKKMEQLARRFMEEQFSDEATVTLREGRLVVPVKEQYKNVVRGFVHDISASGQTVFIEPVEALEFNNALRALQIRETKEIERILLHLTDLIRARSEHLFHDAAIFTDLEVLYAKAEFARLLQAAKPILNDTGGLRLINARHPILWMKESRKKPEERKPIVPLTLSLGQTAEERILIISGPNAGGKSVALKTVGLLSLMAQCGLPIPADYGSSLTVFKKILADIGDAQSIENDLSTFSSHARKLAAMTEQADSQSLILIDEIGSSTSPKEGAALAIAVLESFLENNTLAVVTTHHGELKAFAHRTFGIQNASMQFNPETLEPTYVFRTGIPGSSYAFDIARRMGVTEPILRRAQTLAGEDIHRLESLIQDLQQRTADYEKKLSDLSREKSRLEGLQKLYEEKIKQMQTETRDLRKKLLAEKEDFLTRAKKEIEDTIAAVRKDHASAASVHTARHSISTFRQQIRPEKESLRKEISYTCLSENDLQPGMRVYIPSMEMEGTILSQPDPAGLLLVGVGQLKIRLATDQIVKPQTAPPPEKTVIRSGNKIEWDTEHIKNEIDLRGLTVEDAIARVDEYLANARVMGFTEVRLIHGKGTGALRKNITRYLQNDCRVQSFRLGQWGEGDTGVTVVTLNTD